MVLRVHSKVSDGKVCLPTIPGGKRNFFLELEESEFMLNTSAGKLAFEVFEQPAACRELAIRF